MEKFRITDMGTLEIRMFKDRVQFSTTPDYQEVIAELDRVMEREFVATFKAVAAKFKDEFVNLFSYATIRIILEPNVMRKLPFLNVFSFAISGIIALLIPHPLGIIAAVAYFVGSTFESNAIASTWAGGVEE